MSTGQGEGKPQYVWLGWIAFCLLFASVVLLYIASELELASGVLIILGSLTLALWGFMSGKDAKVVRFSLIAACGGVMVTVGSLL